MKTAPILRNFILLCVGLMSFATLQAQVTVTGSTGADGGSPYATLRAAFAAINSNATQTGNNIVVTITANTTEPASAVLNAGNWTTLRIFPTTTGLTVSGNLPTPLIDLNGADNVTIDGSLNGAGSTPDLTISNTNTSATAGTSTIRFIADASANRVQFCNLQGSNLYHIGYRVLQYRHHHGQQ